MLLKADAKKVWLFSAVFQLIVASGVIYHGMFSSFGTTPFADPCPISHLGVSVDSRLHFSSCGKGEIENSTMVRERCSVKSTSEGARMVIYASENRGEKGN